MNTPIPFRLGVPKKQSETIEQVDARQEKDVHQVTARANALLPVDDDLATAMENSLAPGGSNPVVPSSNVDLSFSMPPPPAPVVPQSCVPSPLVPRQRPLAPVEPFPAFAAAAEVQDPTHQELRRRFRQYGCNDQDEPYWDEMMHKIIASDGQRARNYIV
ncbi:uncharacterized protein RCC_08735 [Ramularia collo-cygni]|uniref:Uncharacterized protein n=1 Tax=Ramularia collo-cygni TaxID=112498 RepID=A0A2D3VBH9_9PEZI|nr:uncharacterized protein RCC_08735 [Ramularia collo-cygni]CZT23025.1 uncharacterized protein RCC_08735 [Ramularia collo-cygni]